MMQINQHQTISGILVLDKPVGISSNAALVRTKKLFHIKKAGHTGSLDPLASGMLPICLGEATKYSTFLLEADKCYQAKAKLGIRTSTGDAEGSVTNTKTVPDFGLDDIEKALSEFRGAIHQVPPMYSALKHQGKPLYYYARKGESIERAPREVNIEHLTCLSFDHDEILLDIKCSKGTYIRTLVEDIGEQLGCGAYLSMLRRYQVSDISVSNMVALEVLEQMAFDERVNALCSVDKMLQHWPEVQLDSEQSKKIMHGQKLTNLSLNLANIVRIHDHQKQFLGMARYENGILKPLRMVKNMTSSINV